MSNSLFRNRWIFNVSPQASKSNAQQDSKSKNNDAHRGVEKINKKKASKQEEDERENSSNSSDGEDKVKSSKPISTKDKKKASKQEEDEREGSGSSDGEDKVKSSKLISTKDKKKASKQAEDERESSGNSSDEEDRVKSSKPISTKDKKKASKEAEEEEEEEEKEESSSDDDVKRKSSKSKGKKKGKEEEESSSGEEDSSDDKIIIPKKKHVSFDPDSLSSLTYSEQRVLALERDLEDLKQSVSRIEKESSEWNTKIKKALKEVQGTEKTCIKNNERMHTLLLQTEGKLSKEHKRLFNILQDVIQNVKAQEEQTENQLQKIAQESQTRLQEQMKVAEQESAGIKKVLKDMQEHAFQSASENEDTTASTKRNRGNSQSASESEGEKPARTRRNRKYSRSASESEGEKPVSSRRNNSSKNEDRAEEKSGRTGRTSNRNKKKPTGRAASTDSESSRKDSKQEAEASLWPKFNNIFSSGQESKASKSNKKAKATTRSQSPAKPKENSKAKNTKSKSISPRRNKAIGSEADAPYRNTRARKTALSIMGASFPGIATKKVDDIAGLNLESLGDQDKQRETELLDEFECELSAWDSGSEQNGNDSTKVEAEAKAETMPEVKEEVSTMLLAEGFHNMLHYIILHLRTKTLASHHDLDDMVVPLSEVAKLDYPDEKKIESVSDRQAVVLKLVTCLYQTVCVIAMEEKITPDDVYSNEDLLFSALHRVHAMV